MMHAPSPTLPGKRGRGRTEFAARALHSRMSLQLICQTANAAPAGLREAPDALRPFFRSPKNEGEQSADRRWCGSAAPDGPSRERTDLRIAGDHRPDRRPARLSALCCGVFLTAAGRAFVDGASVPIDRQPAPGRGSWCPRAEPRRRPSARVRTSPAGATPTKARNCRAPAAGRLWTSSPIPPPACSTLKTPHECAPR